MSALGQKPTFAPQQVMSALPPIATSIAIFGMSAIHRSMISSMSFSLADTPSVVVELIAPSDVENFGDDSMQSESSGNSRVIKIQVEGHVVSELIVGRL
jgi:hypothetical protein